MREKRILRYIPEDIIDPTEVVFSLVDYEKKPHTHPISLQHYSIEGLKELVEDLLKAFDKPILQWERPKIKELKEY